MEERLLASSTKVPAFRPTDSFDAKRVVGTYMDNIKKAKALSDTFGVSALFFLQPIPWYGQYVAKNVNAGFPFGNKKTAFSAYEEIAAKFSNRVDANTLHNTLLNHETPFVDDFHYSDSANALLASKIAEIVIQSIK